MYSKFFKIIVGVFIFANLGMDNAVYYKYSEEDDSEFKVENVDLGTFKILNDKYAKDRKNVYFSGNKSFVDVDGRTVGVLPQ